MKVGLLKSDPGTLFSEGVAQCTQQEKGGEGRGLTTHRPCFFKCLLSKLDSGHACNSSTQETEAV